MTHKQSAELTKPGVGSLQDPAACVVAHLTSVFIARLFVVLAVGRNQFDGPPVNIPHAAGRSGSQHRAITALSAVWVALISAPNFIIRISGCTRNGNIRNTNTHPLTYFGSLDSEPPQRYWRAPC